MFRSRRTHRCRYTDDAQTAKSVAGSPSIALKHIGYILRFLWNATRGHHLAPWRSRYLLWRIETYTGIKMQSIGFLEFCGFSWRERVELLRFLTWTGEMERYARVKPKNP